MEARAAGILLPLASLPGPHGIGDLGAGARDTLDWMVAAGFTVWQFLPVHPTDAWGSPYAATSAFAGNPLLLDLADLVDRGLLDRADLSRAPAFPRNAVDYDRAAVFKLPLLERAARALIESGAGGGLSADLDAFRRREGPIWLDDASLHAALSQIRGGAPWWRWEDAAKRRDGRTMRRARIELKDAIDRYVAIQFLFSLQWRTLRDLASSRGIRLFGDVPIYVDRAAADVWAHPELFSLDERLAPRTVGGVPPDYFSQTGQKWGNPTYRWRAHRKERFRWWTSRLEREVALADIVRLDHFRGLSACYEIPARAKDARHGVWIKAPGRELLDTAVRALGAAPFAAEDLGDIDDDVIALRDAFGLPGMAVLQFAFGGDDSPHLPHNHRALQVAYTGTHDNDTLLGWWRSAEPSVRRRVRRYFGMRGSAKAMCLRLLRACFESPARLAVVPAQDVLELGSEARTNTPGAPPGASWRWRLRRGGLGERQAQRMRDIISATRRA